MSNVLSNLRVASTNSGKISVAVTASEHDPAARRAAANLASELGLLWTEPGPGQEFQLLLVYTPKRLELRDCRDMHMGPVFAEFGDLDVRPFSPNLSRRQPFARAIGSKNRVVVDATAGLGHDAFLLACMGYRVTAIERNGAVVALLRDGLRRAQQQETLSRACGNRLHLVTADAREVLPDVRPKPDVIYLDPMFPPKRKKSAAVKKEIRLLRMLVGDDADAQELLEISRRCATDRVVVKRPDHAPALAPKPTVSYSGKLVRYDVYHTRASHRVT
ncbi:MAG: 16S rRNA (guanine(1516)-N(2))-methyltransferase RsmJ [Gammaproteobacteria bacterium]|nr:MAG: 16S rRNA (guanine(1516)-N(2))-methyltransferase RsmJ [Gammaproteobacteria bacterium]